jgi:hypothetical protein
MYEHRGVHAWTVEIWSPQKQAGITDYKFIDWFRDHPFEDEIKLLNWSDDALGGRGYIDWTPFDHPQLGAVEIGGWDMALAWRNPPPEFIDSEITPLAEWTIWLGGTIPRLEEKAFRSEPAGEAFKIAWAVQNTGWLPTNVSKMAEKKGLCRGIVFEIEPEGGMGDTMGTDRPDWLIAGALRHIGPNLSGWSSTPAGGFGWSFDDTSDAALTEWVVKPGRYRLIARHERAGRVERIITV